MARCEVCKKSRRIVKKGRHRQTKNVAKHGSMGLRGVKSPKKIQPNVRKVKITVGDNRKIKITMCMGCYKRFQKEESFRARVLSHFAGRC